MAEKKVMVQKMALDVGNMPCTKVAMVELCRVLKKARKINTVVCRWDMFAWSQIHALIHMFMDAMANKDGGPILSFVWIIPNGSAWENCALFFDALLLTPISGLSVTFPVGFPMHLFSHRVQCCAASSYLTMIDLNMSGSLDATAPCVPCDLFLQKIVQLLDPSRKSARACIETFLLAGVIIKDRTVMLHLIDHLTDPDFFCLRNCQVDDQVVVEMLHRMHKHHNLQIVGFHQMKFTPCMAEAFADLVLAQPKLTKINLTEEAGALVTSLIEKKRSV